MATGILIIGESGSGKSTSIRNLDPSETYIINVQGKPLPWRGSKDLYGDKNLMRTDSSQKICAVLTNVSDKASHIKTVVIDDFQYIMVNELMRRVAEKGYDKFNAIARGTWDLLNHIQGLRADLIVVFLAHSETTATGKEKVKTVGKMLDEQVNIEGMFSVVLKAFSQNGAHLFSTKTNGQDTAKSPAGMFDTDTIPNDLKIVIEAINNY